MKKGPIIKLLSLTALALALLLASCASYAPEPEEISTPSVVPIETEGDMPSQTFELTYAQMLEDYDYYWDILENDITFIYTAMRNIGIDVDKVREGYRSKITEETPKTEFAEIMAACSLESKFKGHLLMVLNDDIKNTPMLKDAKKSTGSSPYFRYLHNILNNPRTVDIYKYVNDDLLYDHFSRLPSPWFSLNPVINTLSVKRVSSYVMIGFSEDHQIAYMNIEKFYGDSFPSEILSEFYDQLPEYENLVIDIRQNGGGLASGWQNDIVRRIVSDDIKYVTYSNLDHSKNTQRFYIEPYGILDGSFKNEIGRYFYINEYSYFLRTTYVNAKDYLGESDLLSKTLSDYPLADGVIRDETTIYKYPNSISYKGKIWVLTSSTTFSAADSFTHFCNATNFATTVGTRTGGNGIFSESIGFPNCFFSLPNSGLLFKYYPFIGINLDGSSDLEGGDEPDIYTEGDAFEACLEAIRAGAR